VTKICFWPKDLKPLSSACEADAEAARGLLQVCRLKQRADFGDSDQPLLMAGIKAQHCCGCRLDFRKRLRGQY
jgi:hypothetical protein